MFRRVVGSNPGTIYWMDITIFPHVFVVRIVGNVGLKRRK